MGAASGVVEAVADGVGVQSASWVGVTVSVMLGAGEVETGALAVGVAVSGGSVDVRVAATVEVAVMALAWFMQAISIRMKTYINGLRNRKAFSLTCRTGRAFPDIAEIISTALRDIIILIGFVTTVAFFSQPAPPAQGVVRTKKQIDPVIPPMPIIRGITVFDRWKTDIHSVHCRLNRSNWCSER